ncbi:MAG: hypothetical protein RLZZ21_2940 [Planctomycetota bacterium]
MINVMGHTGCTSRPTSRCIRSIIQRFVAGTAMAALPLAPLFAEPFELSGSVPSVMVEQHAPTATDYLSASLPAASFAESFTAATCTDGCTTCGDGGCRCGNCGGDPPGFLQKLCGIHDKTGACWAGRVDALILWRNAPPDRLLVQTGDEFATPVLDANQLDSTAAAGPRVSLIRRDKCSGNAWEATYLRAANFRSQRYLPVSSEFAYAIAPPGIYDNNEAQAFDEGAVNLGSRLQSFEFNRLIAEGQRFRWLAGFRWVEWQENFSLADANYQFDPPINDLYQTDTINSLYGGQIGAELCVLTLPWLRVDSVVKAGAYYNNAVQRSSYTTDEFDLAGETVSIRVGDSPASCGFIGEVGMTGVMPITSCLDFRFGYFALWLSGIAQPTQQLSGQTLVPGEDPSGSLATNGGVVVQGVTLGLEGRW